LADFWERRPGSGSTQPPRRRDRNGIRHFVMAVTAGCASACQRPNVGPSGGRIGQSTAMKRFIRRENIKRFRKLLLEAKDDAERRRLQKLLIEEEQKESAAETPSPSTAPRLSDVSSRRLPALTANVSDTAERVRKRFSRR
jgi:hypothetical protein